MNRIIFPSPLDASCVIRHDTAGWTLSGVPALDPEGRPGQAFDIPDATIDGHGFALHISAVGYDPLHQRGVLRKRDGRWVFEMDDFHLVPTVEQPTGGSIVIVDDHFMMHGQRWFVRGVDGFCDHWLLLTGQRQALLDQVRQAADLGANLRRVFGMMKNLKTFDPATYGEGFFHSLPELFGIYADYGMVGEYDVLPDSQYWGKSLGWCQGHWARTCDTLRPIQNRLVSLTNEFDHGGNLVGTPNDYPRPNFEPVSQGSAVSDAPPPRPGWGFREFHALKSWPKIFLCEDMMFNREGVDAGGATWGPRKPIYLSECSRFDETNPYTDERLARTLAYESLAFGEGLVLHNQPGRDGQMMGPRVASCVKTAMDILARAI